MKYAPYDAMKKSKVEVITDENNPENTNVAFENLAQTVETENQTQGKTEAKTVAVMDTEPIIKLLFNQILASRFGEHWKLERQEITQLKNAANALLAKYAISFGKYSEEINFVAIAGMIILPRLGLNEGVKDDKTGKGTKAK